MKTFKQYLAEKQQAHSVAETILFGESEPPLIFTPAMMKRLDYSIPGIRAFHITEVDLLPSLMKLQGKKNTQLSTLTYLNDDGPLLSGIETEGGVVAELYGQIDTYFSADAFTGLLKGGRRSVLIDPHNDFGMAVRTRYRQIIGTGDAVDKMIVSYINDLQLKLRTALVKMLDKHIIDFLGKTFPDVRIARSEGYFDAFEQVQFSGFQLTLIDIMRNYPGGTRVLQTIVKEYLDAQEKIMRDNPHFKKLFLMPVENDHQVTYDEALMSNLKVTKIHVYRQGLQTMPTLESVADELRDEYSVPVELWEFPGDLKKYINRTSTDFSDIMRAKVSK